MKAVACCTLIAVAIATVLGACTDELLPSPEAVTARSNAALATQLDRQVQVLPGVVTVRTLITRPSNDLLAPPLTPQKAHVSLAVDARTSNPAELTRNVRTLAAAVIVDAEITVVLSTEPPSAAFAKLGPFEVAPHSRRPLLFALGGGLVLIVALGGFIAWRERGRR